MTLISGDGRAKHPLDLPRPDQQWRHIVSACMVEAGFDPPGWHVEYKNKRRAHIALSVFEARDSDLIDEWWATFWRAVSIADGANVGITHQGGPNRGCWIAVS